MKKIRKIAAFALALITLFSLSSCKLAMRDTYEDNTKTVTENKKEDAPELKIAEKTNTVGLNEEVNDTTDDQETEVVPENTKTVTLAIAGDIKLSEQMIEDARAQAPEGKDYAFLRMYTGAYRTINNADIAIGSYSAVGKPYGTESDYEPPTEHLDALAALGFDILDISGCGSDYRTLEEHELRGISSAEEGDDAIRTVEAEGITFAFISAASNENTAQNYTTDDFIARIEYADLISDYLVVFVRWKDDMTRVNKCETAKKLANSGADLIIGDGETTGAVEVIEKEDGSTAAVAYSLGNLLSDANEACNLCSEVLTVSFDVETDEDGNTLFSESQFSVIPMFVHYTLHEDESRGDYSIYRVEDYTSDIAASHPAEVDPIGLKEYIKSTVDTSLLPDAFSN